MGKYEDQICQAVDVITNQKINKAVFDRFKKYNKFSKHKLSKIY